MHHRNDEHSLPTTRSIQIKTQSDEGREVWRLVRATFDMGAQCNLISQQLVLEKLGVSVVSSRTPDAVIMDTGGKYVPTDSVSLVWRLYDSKNLHTTWFFVTEERDPWFDVIVGADFMAQARCSPLSQEFVNEGIFQPEEIAQVPNRQTSDLGTTMDVEKQTPMQYQGTQSEGDRRQKGSRHKHSSRHDGIRQGYLSKLFSCFPQPKLR